MAHPDAAGAVMWSVIDKNAKFGPREHEGPSGQLYALKAREATSVPAGDAIVFLRDAAFRVFDENGHEQVPIPEAENLDARRARPDLPEGHTIAKYEELTEAALMARVALRPGGTKMLGVHDRGALIDFLNTSPTIADLDPLQRSRNTGFTDPDEMTAAEAAATLGPVALPTTGRGDGGQRPRQAPIPSVRENVYAGEQRDPLAMAG